MSVNPVVYHPSHDFVMDEWGVDIFAHDPGDPHNGPRCRKCGEWCHHCDTARASEPCPSPANAEGTLMTTCPVCGAASNWTTVCGSVIKMVCPENHEWSAPYVETPPRHYQGCMCGDCEYRYLKQVGRGSAMSENDEGTS